MAVVQTYTHRYTKGATKNGIKFFKIWLECSNQKKEKPKMYICRAEVKKKERTASQWPFTTSTTKTEPKRTEKMCI